MAQCLLYTLALVANVLLVNLLIAVTNSTYEQNLTGQAGVPCPLGVFTMFVVMTLQKAGGFEYQDMAHGFGGSQSFLCLFLCS